MANLVESSELSYTQVIRLRCYPAVIINQACVCRQRADWSHQEGCHCLMDLSGSMISHVAAMTLGCSLTEPPNSKQVRSFILRWQKKINPLRNSQLYQAVQQMQTVRLRYPEVFTTMAPSWIHCWHPKHLVSRRTSPALCTTLKSGLFILGVGRLGELSILCCVTMNVSV